MRLRRTRFVAAAVVATIATTSTARASDYYVDFECIGSDEDAVYQLRPDPIVLEAGVDRVVFQTGEHDRMLPCAAAANSPHIDLLIWGPGAVSFLWYTGMSTAPQGPFCEAGVYRYQIYLRGSHGEINVVMKPGTIRVTEPTGDAVPAGATIGVFAEPSATNCFLPATPGAHRAYVCVRSHDRAAISIAAAEFRIDGFPANWNVIATPAPTIFGGSGDPLGAGVQLYSWCDPPATDVIVFYTLDYVVPAGGPMASIEVHAATQFGSTRPWVARCNGRAAAEQMCALGGRAAAGTVAGPCVVGIAPTTWSQVRYLYR